MNQFSTHAFRIVCMLFSVILFFGSVTSFSKGEQTMGLLALAASCNLLASSNVFDPAQKFSIRDLKNGDAKWDLSTVGVMLNWFSIFLYGACLVSLTL